MRTACVLMLVWWLATAVHASDRLAEIVRIHVAAIGGEARVAALTSVRMVGTVTTASGETLAQTIIAARPARLHATTTIGNRTIVQASDGVARPWQRETVAGSGAVFLSAAAAERFLMDAEFDDPLVRAKRGEVTAEFAGEVELLGRKWLRVLVARALTQNVFVLVDPTTYLIGLRVQQVTRGDGRVEVVTRYSDFRPVAGVLLPHEMALFEDGRLRQTARFVRIEGNPPIDDALFLPPAGTDG